MKLILKGILLWFTAIVDIMWLFSISNITEFNKLDWCIITTTCMIILNYICYHTISYRELLTLSLYKYINSYLKLNS